MLSRIWIVVLLSMCACPSFANVKMTAQLGRALGDQPIVVSEWVTECEAVHAAPTDPALETICRASDKRYENMVIAVRDASALLQDYATALQTAADDKDVTVADDATAVLGQIGKLNTHAVKEFAPAVFNLANVIAKDQALTGKLTPSGIATIVDTVTRFASQSYRRTEIVSAVTTAAPHVDALAAFVEAEAKLHLEDVVSLRGAIAAEVSARPLTDATPAVAQVLPLAGARLDDRIVSLTQLIAACQAFRASHAKLAERIHHDRPWQNSEMLTEIKTDVENIIAALQGTASAGAAATAAAATPATTTLSTTSH